MKKTTRQQYVQRLHRVIDYIFEHLDDNLDVNTLADIAILSPYHFHRIYRQVIRETVNTTVRRLRLQKAAAQLIRTQQPIAAIAKQTYYSSIEAFSRAFLQQYGESPVSYRKRCEHHLSNVGTNNVLLRRTAESTQQPLQKQDDKIMFDIEIINIDQIPLLGIDHKGDYMNIGSIFEKLFVYAGSHGLLTDNTRSFGIYYDDPQTVDIDKLRSVACFSSDIGADTLDNPSLRNITIPAMACARLVFKGSYAELNKAYDYLFGSWLPNSGREAGDFPAFEEYLNDPKTTPPAELLTAIHCPLK